MNIDFLYNCVSQVTFRNLDDCLTSKGLPDEIKKELARHSYQVTLEKGDVLSESFDDAAFIFIDDGMVRNNMETAEGKIRNCSFFLKGNSFTYFPSYSHPLTYSVSLEKTTLSIISGNAFYESSRKSKQVFDFILREIAAEREFLRDWVIFGEMSGKRNHLLYSLLLIAINAKVNEKSYLPVKYQDFADMSGTSTPYAISVIRESIEAGAFKKVYNGIEILELDSIFSLIDVEPLEAFMRSVTTSVLPKV